MGLHLHRADRTDLLADALGDLLATPSGHAAGDAFAEEVVVVPAKGVERWLTQRLSHRLGVGPTGGDGVCAGVRFVSPRSLVAELLGREYDDPWEPDRLVWPLLEAIDASLGEPWCRTLSHHLGHGQTGEEQALRSSRRYAVAHRLAGLFAGYARQRPRLICEWAAGDDTDGAGGRLDDDLVWQPELWRRLVARVAAPSPEVRQAQTLAALRAGGDALDLPGRLSLFGHTRIPVTEVELLAALAEHRDVHLWLPQASAALWQALEAPTRGGPVRRTDDGSAAYVGNALLASLGRDSRELQRALGPVPADDHEHAAVDEPADTLLRWLQGDIRANRTATPVELASREHTAADRSVQVHACHGPARQVEVLREVLVGLLQDDQSLEPRDIVVMCPDVETYAPLIHATFGLDLGRGGLVSDGHPGHELRVRLADRSLSRTNPLLAVAEALVALAGGRAEASTVLDLLARDVCRRRFRIDDDDLARISRWVDEAGVRWGLDAGWRQRYLMGNIGQNTWQAGLERILTGVAMSGDDHLHLGRALPLDDVASSDIELAGALAEFVDRVGVCLTALDRAETAPEWLAAIAEGVLALTEVPADDAWQRAQLERELASMADAAHGSGDGPPRMRLADIRSMLTQRLAGRPTRANFRTGTLTVCTMVPMRSVPHRVVCLLGLDDGVFPRSQWVDGDDVLARAPLTGEHDRRAEDRQLLLDAVLAAREHLVVCYSGADEHTGAEVPPAVPVGELLDALDVTCAAPVRGRVLVKHPLQAHHWSNLTGERPFSFDRTTLAGARAASGPLVPRPPLVDGPLSPLPPGDVNLDDLKRFLAHPVREFCKARLEIGVSLEAPEEHDAIPIELDALEAWAVGDRLLRDLLDGLDPVSVMTAEQLRGTLPPGALGQTELTKVIEQVKQIWDRTTELRQGPARAVDVDVDLGGGRRLTGTVTGVHGHRVVDIRYSRPRARQRIESWLDLLALSAAHPDRSWTAHAVGRQSKRAVAAIAGPLDHRAIDRLRDLVAIYDEGLTRPLPAPPLTALAWQAAVLEGAAPLPAASREWVTDPNNRFGIKAEDADPWHVRVYGDKPPLSALTGLPVYAERIWGPLLAVAPRVRPL